MTRFEIQDIAYQNHDGVTFHTLDRETNQMVSLRRFFPFGQEEPGLDPQDREAFLLACQQLSQVQHPALRRTILGDVDPVDGMPFLVTEWIDGESVADVLGLHTMDPSTTIELIRQAIDVCKVLSAALEKEAVWIDTKLESIIISNSENKPTFSFRICPFKWLGTQNNSIDLSGIVSMVEAVLGWESKPVSDHAGRGLGGWLKLLRQSPHMSLDDALKILPDKTAQPSANPTAGPVTKPMAPVIVSSKKPTLFTGKRITIMALSTCLTAAIIFHFYQKKQKQLASNDDQIEIVAPTETTQPSLVNTASLKATEKPTLSTEPNIFSPDDVEAIAKIKSNQPAAIKGVVKSVRIPKPGNGMYIAFTQPWDGKQIQAVMYPKSFEGGPYNDEDFAKVAQKFQKLVGKTVTFRGAVSRHVATVKPHYIHVEKYGQIIVDGKTIQETLKEPSASAIFKPNDLGQIKKLEKKSPVKLQGLLKSVKFNHPDQSAIVLYFSEPYKVGELRGVAYKSHYKDSYELKEFDKFLGKEILIDGILKEDQTKNPFLIEIIHLDQISIVSK